MGAEADYVCTQCHTRQLVGPSVGSPLIGLLALVFAALAFLTMPLPLDIIVGGICIGVMVFAGRPAAHRCRACGAATLIPVSTPAGRQLVGAPIAAAPRDQDEELRHFGVTQDGEAYVWGTQRFASPEAALMFAKSRA